MPYQRSNKLPAMIAQVFKLYAGKRPWLLAAIAGLVAFAVMGVAWAVMSCGASSGCPSHCNRGAATAEPTEATQSPCGRMKAEHHGEAAEVTE